MWMLLTPLRASVTVLTVLFRSSGPRRLALGLRVSIRCLSVLGMHPATTSGRFEDVSSLILYCILWEVAVFTVQVTRMFTSAASGSSTGVREFSLSRPAIISESAMLALHPYVSI